MRAAHVLTGTSLVLAVTLGVTAGRMPTPERYDIDPAHTAVQIVSDSIKIGLEVEAATPRPPTQASNR